jgi:hypothetical protein
LQSNLKLNAKNICKKHIEEILGRTSGLGAIFKNVV